MNSYEIPGGNEYQPLDEATLDEWFSKVTWCKKIEDPDPKFKVLHLKSLGSNTTEIVRADADYIDGIWSRLVEKKR